MATLYDLAMQYLNQSLPKTFKYDRTPPIGINPPTQPGGPPEPIAKILPVQGGSDNFSVYNSDPNRTRTQDNYSPYNYRTASEKSYIGAPGDYSYSSATEAQKMMDMYPDYYTGNKQLKGIPGAIANYAKNSLAGQLLGKAASGLENLLPVNQRAILENELLGQGFQLNDIGQFVSDGGDINKADGSNIMAGYSAYRTDADTFQKRRDMINAKMSDTNINPKTGKTYKEEKLAALAAAEDKFFGGSGKATTVFNDKLKQKDIDDGFINDQISTYDEEDNEEFDPTDFTKTGINTFQNINPFEINNIVELQKQQDAIKQQELINQNAMDPGTVVDNSAPPNNNPNEDHDGDGVPNNVEAAGGSYDGGYQGAEGGFEYTGDFGDPYSDDNFMAGDNSKASPTGSIFDSPVTGTTKPGESGGTDSPGGKSIVCTAMYQTTGLEDWSKAMKIWYIYQKKYLTIQHQEGYHKLFKPFVKGMHKNKIIRAIGAHIAKHRTQDLKHIMFGSKPSWLGRVYRKILEPICYFVGKHG